MASGTAHMTVTALPSRETLVDSITELFRRAGKVDTLNTPRTKTALSHSDTTFSLRCISHLLEESPEALAKEAYCFMPTDHDVADIGRPSFKQFQQQWKRECGKTGKGDGSFPETRRRNATDPFLECTLRCICRSCSQDNAVDLRCDAYDFGNDHIILIHQFPWDGETWAVILGTRDHPEEYSIWGMIDENTKQTSYHDRVRLREISSAKTMKRSSRYAFDTGDDEEFMPGDERRKTRAKASTALNSSKRRRTLAGAASNKESAPKSMEVIAKTNMYTPVSDDEEDLTLSQLSESRRKVVADASSAATPVPARASSPQHASPNVQQSGSHDLQKAFLDARAHVNSQVDSDGLPFICSNARLETYVRGLQAAASKNNAYVFGSMRDMIDGELEKVGLQALPGTWNSN